MCKKVQMEPKKPYLKNKNLYFILRSKKKKKFFRNFLENCVKYNILKKCVKYNIFKKMLFIDQKRAKGFFFSPFCHFFFESATSKKW